MNEHSFIFTANMRVRDENKETAIREKAMEIIMNEGFEGLSMQKLAKIAGVSPATIYIYFRNREDLLNQLFIEVQRSFSATALEGFDPDMSFRDGLWLQWKNRLRFIIKYPTHFAFFESFRNSPLINHSDIDLSDFKINMRLFVKNAIKRGDIKKMEPEIFWSIAYGSFYTLVNFHMQEKSMMSNTFRLTETSMKVAFDMVIKAFNP